MDRIIETAQGIIRTLEVTSEEAILEEIHNPQIRIIKVKILEMDTKRIIEILIMK